MNEIIKAKLETILKKFKVDKIVFAHTSNFELFQIENGENVDYPGLFPTLFGGKEEIKRLYSSLEGQILPTSWGQGKQTCVIDKTTNDFILGVFRTYSEDFLTEYHRDNEICSLVKEILEQQ